MDQVRQVHLKIGQVRHVQLHLQNRTGRTCTLSSGKKDMIEHNRFIWNKNRKGEEMRYRERYYHLCVEQEKLDQGRICGQSLDVKSVY